jgi:hypothetical protein
MNARYPVVVVALGTTLAVSAPLAQAHVSRIAPENITRHHVTRTRVARQAHVSSVAAIPANAITGHRPLP